MIPVATPATMSARCPLCGESVLDVNSDGRVLAAEVRPIPLHKYGLAGEGYLVCDSCGFLAQADITLN